MISRPCLELVPFIITFIENYFKAGRFTFNLTVLLKIIVNVYIKNHILVAQCIEFLFFFSIFFFISRYKLVNDIREQISSIRR